MKGVQTFQTFQCFLSHSKKGFVHFMHFSETFDVILHTSDATKTIFNQTIRNEVVMLTVNKTEKQTTKNIVTHKPVLDFIQFSPNPLSIVWQCDHHDHCF